MISSSKAASLIDISAVRTHHTLKDIIQIVEYARQYRFVNVHVLPSWVAALALMLRDIDGVFVGSPVGFPSGAQKTITKVVEAQQLILDGVEEMDIVMNIGKFKNREYDYVLNELKTIIGLTDKRVLTKVIIEINVLEDDEIMRASELVIKSGADFLKTGTGWIPGSANIDKIIKIKEYCRSDIKIKAAGGIRTIEDFLELYKIGVERMGINMEAAIEIVEFFCSDHCLNKNRNNI